MKNQQQLIQLLEPTILTATLGQFLNNFIFILYFDQSATMQQFGYNKRTASIASTSPSAHTLTYNYLEKSHFVHKTHTHKHKKSAVIVMSFRPGIKVVVYLQYRIDIYIFVGVIN